ncbi:MAG TPA: glycoside hydrolase family 15 protein [Pedococcus sp.]
MGDGDKERPAQRPHALRDHALIADGERGAIVGPQGNLAWLCVPRWDDEPVFASLLGGHGTYVVRPRDPWHVWGGSYQTASLVWRSRWVTTEAIIECDEALAFPGQRDLAVVLRRIRAVSGDAKVHVLLRPSGGFDGRPVDDFEQDNGVWTGTVGDLRVRWTGARHARPGDRGELVMDLEVPEGQTRDLVLELARTTLPTDPVTAEMAWEATTSSWDELVPQLPDVFAGEDVRQSYAVLRGLTSADHGMVAAATMSLPERSRGGRDYDYRYAWVRDQCYTGQAVAALGAFPLLESALDFVTDRILEDGPDLKPAYRVDGGPVPDEHHVGLPGYPGGGDVVGNWVNGQFQLDTLGETLSMVAAASRHDMVTSRHWKAVRTAVQVVEDRWRKPDAGIWELDDALWTHSRLSCVAGLRAIGSVAPGPEGVQWTTLADRILAGTSEDCLHPSGRWQQSPENPGVDAALLLPPVRGALGAHDPRTVLTRQAVRRDLATDGFVYRFRHDTRPLGDAEGAFTLCGFLMSMACAHAGEGVEAMHYFERARASCATSGLFTEEFDVRQRQLRGNFPQAFVHAMFIEAATVLQRLLEAEPPTTATPGGTLP